ncbi:CoA-binding protein [Helicobacter equorum]|uniref:CoA-binding protein n=1 Tax=Helicobacter equorum TaxID=361872 RepID=UPI000CF0B4EF|nr:CoA-binding protein [Helicobacter equorum]
MNLSNQDIASLLINAKSIAICGLSPDSQKDSFQVAQYLQDHNFDITPIYPKEDIILGEKVYQSLSEAVQDKKHFDIVVAFRNARACEELAEEILSLPHGSVGVFWMQLGIHSDEVARRLGDSHIPNVQDKCIKIEYAKL